jgi:ABC-type sugar transport system substrate-binding protein
LHYFEESDRPQPKLDRNYENGMGITMGRLREDKVYDYKFVGLSHNTLRGAAGGGVLSAEYLKAAGYFKDNKYMPVVGVDATAPGLQALSDGTLLGTVLNDAKNQGKATLELAYALAQGKTPDKSSTGYDITDGKYVWIPYVKITKDNMDQAK